MFYPVLFLTTSPGFFSIHPATTLFLIDIDLNRHSPQTNDAKHKL